MVHVGTDGNVSPAVGFVGVFGRSVVESRGGGGGGGGGLNLPDERGQLRRGGPLAREENPLPLRRSLQRRPAARVVPSTLHSTLSLAVQFTAAHDKGGYHHARTFDRPIVRVRMRVCARVRVHTCVFE